MITKLVLEHKISASRYNKIKEVLDNRSKCFVTTKLLQRDLLYKFQHRQFNYVFVLSSSDSIYLVSYWKRPV